MCFQVGLTPPDPKHVNLFSLTRVNIQRYEEIVGPPPWPDLVSISCSVSKGKYRSLAEFENETRKIFTNAISYHGGKRKGDVDVGVVNTCCGSVVQDHHRAADYDYYPGSVPYIAKFAEEFLAHFDVEMSKLRTLLLYKRRNEVRIVVVASLSYFFISASIYIYGQPS